MAVTKMLLYQPAETLTHRRHCPCRARRQYPIGSVYVFAMDVPVGRRQDESGSASFGIKHFEQIANWLAGLEAEKVFKPPGRAFKAAYDFGEVSRILRENGTPQETVEGQKLRERRRAYAEGRLREHRSKVRRLAQHLMEHHYIDRVVFEAMMRNP